MFWYGGGWGFWWVALMWIAMIGFWGLLVWGVWAVARALTRRESGPGARAAPPATGDPPAGSSTSGLPGARSVSRSTSGSGTR